MARVKYVEADSGKYSWWTDDGLHYCIGEVVGATRSGDELIDLEGKPIGMFFRNDQLILDEGGMPAAVEESLYRSLGDT